MPAKNLEQVATYLPKEVKDKLQARADEMGISLAAMIRMILIWWSRDGRDVI